MGSSLRSPAVLHAYAVVLAGATLALIFIGGLVTSTGSGLAVPDWPLAFGQFFPRMVGGVFYEHGHRMAAGVVATLTIVFAIWVAVVERRPLVRRLAFVAVAAVVAQALLGGLTVLLLLPVAISVAHACLAQAFLCVTVALAVVTSPGWASTRAAPIASDDEPSLAALTAATAVVVYVQLILGAVMRHSGAGLAIPDFPLAFGRVVPPFESSAVVIHFAHRVGALVVSCMVVWSAGRVLTRHRDDRNVTRPALLALALLATQVMLGALTIWTRKAVLPTTAHVAVGAALLATTLVLALRARRSSVRAAVAVRGVLKAERVPT